MIAVISNRPGEGSSGGDHANVFLIRADGQQIRQLTENGGSKARLEWANP